MGIDCPTVNEKTDTAIKAIVSQNIILNSVFSTTF